MMTGGTGDETITTTVQTNKRGDVRIPAEVRRALDFDGEQAILEVTVSCKKIIDDGGEGSK